MKAYFSRGKRFESITGKGYWDSRNKKKIALGNKNSWRK
jgi:hypothetical protein